MKLERYYKLSKKQNKREKIAVFYKFSPKSFGSSQKSSTFAPAKQKCIGVWCNGNTADSGPAFPGSSPGTPTDRKRFPRRKPLFFSDKIKNYSNLFCISPKLQ